VPAPESEEDTLLVFAVRMINKSNEAFSMLGNYEILLKRLRREYRCPIYILDQYSFVQGLPPGEYKAVKLSIPSHEKSWDISITLKITNGCLKVAPFEIVITSYKEKQTNLLYQKVEFFPLDLKSVWKL
jgi:hypothetical protein